MSSNHINCYALPARVRSSNIRTIPINVVTQAAHWVWSASMIDYV